MQPNWLTSYGLSLLEVLLILLFIVVLVSFGWWWIRHKAKQMESALADARQHGVQLQEELTKTQQHVDQLQNESTSAQRHAEQLQDELAEAHTQRNEASRELATLQDQVVQLKGEVNDVRAQYDPATIRKLQDEFQTQIAHEFARELNSFVDGCKKTASGLTDDQIDLRVLQNDLRAKAVDLKQHCENIVSLERSDRVKVERRIVVLRPRLERILASLVETYAEPRGVELQPRYQSLPPIGIDWSLTEPILRNVAHNAIKHSRPGDVVEIELRLVEDGEIRQAIIDVRDHGGGISPELQAELFELRRRGVGLPLSRKLARLLGGDVILVSSNPGEGTLFRIILPYDNPGEPLTPDGQPDSALVDRPNGSPTLDTASAGATA
jgi:signal transduction histidine kinase